MAHGATEQGAPVDWFESERVEWVPLADVRAAVAGGQVSDGMTLTALCWCLAFGVLAGE